MNIKYNIINCNSGLTESEVAFVGTDQTRQNNI